MVMEFTHTILLLLCSSRLVFSESFESLDYDYDYEEVGWGSLGACRMLWAEFTDLVVQLADAFSLAYGKFRTKFFYVCLCAFVSVCICA